MLISHLKDAFLHMKWADALIWKSVLAEASAAGDEEVLDILAHLHITQHSFLNAWLNRPFERWKRADFDSTKALLLWAESFYTPGGQYLDSLSQDDLKSAMVLPWAKYFGRQLGKEPVDTTSLETIHQLISHSMHHRGQVAKRIRHLGGAPPLTDYIGWVWMGRPKAEWPLFD